MTNTPAQSKLPKHLEALDELIAAKTECDRQYNYWMATCPTLPLSIWTNREGLLYEARVLRAQVEYDEALRQLIGQCVSDALDKIHKPQ